MIHGMLRGNKTVAGEVVGVKTVHMPYYEIHEL